MPTPRLFTLLQIFMGQKRQDGSASPGFFEQGVIQLVLGRGSAMVSFTDGRLVDAQPTTDEPLAAGMSVWVSKTDTGQYIIHGGVR